jgi:hypothetical protein
LEGEGLMEIFDLYGLLVEHIFGGLFLSIIGIVIFMALIIMISRTSFITGLALIGFFLLVVGIYFNKITYFIIVLGSFVYFIYQVMAFIQQGRN